MWTILKYRQTTWEEGAKKKNKILKVKSTRNEVKNWLGSFKGRTEGAEESTGWKLGQGSESKEEEEKGWAKSKRSTGDLWQLPNLTKEIDINILEAGLHSSRQS